MSFFGICFWNFASITLGLIYDEGLSQKNRETDANEHESASTAARNITTKETVLRPDGFKVVTFTHPDGSKTVIATAAGRALQIGFGDCIV